MQTTEDDFFRLLYDVRRTLLYPHDACYYLSHVADGMRCRISRKEVISVGQREMLVEALKDVLCEVPDLFDGHMDLQQAFGGICALIAGSRLWAEDPALRASRPPGTVYDMISRIRIFQCLCFAASLTEEIRERQTARLSRQVNQMLTPPPLDIFSDEELADGADPGTIDKQSRHL